MSRDHNNELQGPNKIAIPIFSSFSKILATALAYLLMCLNRISRFLHNQIIFPKTQAILEGASLPDTQAMAADDSP